MDEQDEITGAAEAARDRVAQEALDARQLLEEAALLRAVGGRIDDNTVASLVIENRRLRSTNWFFIIGLTLLILSNVLGHIRSFFVTGPKVDQTAETTKKIDEALRGIGSLQAYVDQARATSNPGATAEVFRAIVETHNEVCRAAKPQCAPITLPLPPTTTTTTTTRAGG